MAPGTNLEGMNKVAKQVDEILIKNPEVNFTLYSVGNQYGEGNKANFYVRLTDKRTVSSVQFRDTLRGQLKDFKSLANPIVKKYDAIGGAMSYNL